MGRAARRPHRPLDDASTKLPANPRGVKAKAATILRALRVATAAATLAACAGPQFRPDTPSGSGPIVQEAAGLQVSIEADAWRGRPKWLADYVLPFLVQVKNTSEVPAAVLRTDFLLLDDTNRQYTPLPPSDVVVLLGGRSPGVAISPSAGVTGSTAGGTIFGAGLGFSFGGSTSAVWDVISAALPEGPVQPGDAAQGFLYFPLPASPYKVLRVVFSPRQLPGPPRLDFVFRRP